jgi:hypothetical protein
MLGKAPVQGHIGEDKRNIETYSKTNNIKRGEEEIDSLNVNKE